MPDPVLLRHATTIVTAHVAHNGVPAETLSDVIRTVYAALTKVSAAPTVVTPGVPAVPVNKSVFPDFIVCLEDGRKLKSLKRHLWSSFGLTPDAYRAKWGLPAHYPMISPNYAARRSALAKKIGLGGSEKRTTKDQDRAPRGAGSEDPRRCSRQKARTQEGRSFDPIRRSRRQQTLTLATFPRSPKSRRNDAPGRLQSLPRGAARVPGGGNRECSPGGS
jgi:predicted transcriptional regulator